MADQMTSENGARIFGRLPLERGDLYFRRLLEKLPAGAYTCDRDGLITYFNQEAVSIWGREPVLHDPVDRFCGSFKLFRVDGTPIRHDQCWMALALTTGGEFNGEEILIERPDGRRVYALAHANPIHDEDGELVGAVNVLVDITARKHAEDALQRADRARNEFLAILGHELRNPLAPIRNAVTLLQRTAGGDPAVAEPLEMIDRQLGQMVRLIDDLLDVSRVTSGQLSLDKSRVELAAVVASATETCRPQIETRGQRLEVSLPTEPVHLEADPVRLAQVLTNLLTNASKYSPAGASIRLEAEQRGEMLEVRVSDEGIGISAEILPSVFEPFVQGESSPARSKEGLGIGLSLVRRLVELHGGTVTAASGGAGCGSVFTVQLSASAGDGNRSSSSPTPAEEPRQGSSAARVLVVDDNQDSAESLAAWLELTGNEVHTAYDGEEAVTLAERWRPDVVLLDLAMPKLDGYEVARHIRGTAWGRTVRLLAMTGWGQADDRRRSRAAGFDHHLVKPIDLSVLKTLLESPPTW